MPKTCIQTVVIHMPNSTRKFYGMEHRPIPPSHWTNDYNITITKLDGTIMTWDTDGFVTKTFTDGSEKIWHPKPTINEAVLFQSDHKDCCNEVKTYFQFNPDGSVISYFYSAPYYWSPSIYNMYEEIGFEGNDDYGLEWIEEWNSWKNDYTQLLKKRKRDYSRSQKS